MCCIGLWQSYNGLMFYFIFLRSATYRETLTG
jgi:hypothetical protein